MHDREDDRGCTGPLLIVSAGRSGSTLLLDALSRHPDLSWLPERIADRLPGTAAIRAVLRSGEHARLSKLVFRAFPPGESYGFWERYAPGFADPRRDLLAEDADERTACALRRAFAGLLTRTRRRVVAKTTGWPRLGFLHRVFPDARFIHVARDPRATAHSFTNASWWRKASPPDAWHWGPLAATDAQDWQDCGGAALALAAIQMRIYWRAYAAARARLPEHSVCEVHYEDLCRDPAGELGRLQRFCGLRPAAAVDRWIRERKIVSRDDRWRIALSRDEQQVLERLLDRKRPPAKSARD